MEEKKNLVLIVEDQKINREILKGILHHDYEVLEATNGQEAWDILTKEPAVSVILLDLLMPVMDGYTLLAKIATSPYATIPTIAVTGENDIEAEQKILELGAWDFVTKPYQPMTLLTRLKYAISRNEYFSLGSLLLNSLGVPSAVFEEDGSLIRLIRFSQSYTGELLQELPFSLSTGLLEQPCLNEKDRNSLRESFLALRKDQSPRLLHLSGVRGKSVQLTLRYWGDNRGAMVVFGEFKLL
jgi:CheY-like chemotaxis protein